MTSSVQSHLPSERCLYKRQCPLQEHFLLEDLGVVAGGERSGWSHARAERDARQNVETSEQAALAVLSAEASAHVPGRNGMHTGSSGLNHDASAILCTTECPWDVTCAACKDGGHMENATHCP